MAIVGCRCYGQFMSAEITMRRAGPADAAAIAALTRRAYAKWVPVIGREPRPMIADYDHAVRAHLVDLAEHSEKLLALVEMQLQPDHLLIVNLAVDPSAQGRGLGSRLLARAEERAREHKRTTLRLYTNSLMAPNIALYQHRGYAVDRLEVMAPGWSIVHMVKRLAG